MSGTIYAVVSSLQYGDVPCGVLTRPYIRRMENISDRLRRKMKEMGLTQYRLWKLSGVSQPTIKRILDGDSKEPEKSTVEALAKALGTTYAELYDGRPVNAVRSTTTSENAHENAPVEGAIAIRKKGIPVVGTAQLGDQGFWEELQYPVGHGDGFVDYPSSDPNAYALRCNGTSMEPRFRHGEFLIIEPNFPVNPGDEVMVKLADGRCMAKIFAYARDGLLHLESVNQAHEKITVARDQIEKMHYIAGVAKRGLHRSA